MDMLLNGMHIAILVTDGFEHAQLAAPKKALEAEGAIIKIVSEKHGQVTGVNGDGKADEVTVDLTFGEADAEDFDAVLLPGGQLNASRIRNIPEAQRIVQGAEEEMKPIAAIGDGICLLISAGLTKGRTFAGSPALQKEIGNTGSNLFEQEMVVDGKWLSSRADGNILSFNKGLIDLLAARMASKLRGTPDEHAVGIASS